jgi:integrase/recombinase XerD
MAGSDGYLAEAWLEMLAAERGAARNTLEAYARDLSGYLGCLGGRGTSALAATQADVRAWFAGLEAEGLKASSAARRLSAVRQFHRFLYAEGHRADDPSAAIRGPRKARPLPKTLLMDDAARLVDLAAERAADTARPAAGRLADARMVALVELLYATGLRVSELVSLPRGVLADGAEMIRVRGKGGKERLVPLTGKARAAVAAYLAVQADLAPGRRSPWLFPADSASGHLPRQVFARELKRLGAAAGLRADKLSPHVLRHAFASHLLHNGADLRVVQQLLGHADIATTQIYTHVLDERVGAMVRDLHPLADEAAR